MNMNLFEVETSEETAGIWIIDITEVGAGTGVEVPAQGSVFVDLGMDEVIEVEGTLEVVEAIAIIMKVHKEVTLAQVVIIPQVNLIKN